MASPNGRREGEETGKAEADPGEVKPGQMELFAAMLASMRQELDQRADERAREQAQRAEERAREQAQRAEERAREQAQRAEERADEQARHLADILQSCFSSLKVETQQYTDQGCDTRGVNGWRRCGPRKARSEA
ncbi:ATP synthase subunit b-like [Eriocheir sinensis]|uniref:ATP synthase subunit b-like n=1 Tax=Eriocheir sinensis TaxID=95602 RepID=UPI0021CADA36|nr:ATP synthase subunit b-like [Eriocheir sinensis]